MNELEGATADYFAGRVTQISQGSGLGVVEYGAVGTDEGNAVGGLLDQRPEATFARFEDSLRLLTGGNILDNSHRI